MSGTERGVVRGAGPFYPVPGYPAGPPPAHRVEIWVGAMAPRALELIGRKADGWIPGGGISRIDEFAGLAARIDDAAAAAGRDPRAIRRIVNVSGSITGGGDWRRSPRRPGRECGSTSSPDGPSIYGSTPSSSGHPDAGTGMIEQLAAEVVPAVHEAIQPARDRSLTIWSVSPFGRVYGSQCRTRASHEGTGGTVGA